MQEQAMKITAPDEVLSRLLQWLASVALVLLNLVGELTYQLQSDTCRDATEWCSMGLSDGLLVYILLFSLVAVWHFSDLIPLKSQLRFLKTVSSYSLFSISLVALIASLWIYRASTTVGYHGHFETPIPVMILTVGLIVFVPLLVLAKSVVTVSSFVKIGVTRFLKARSLPNE